MPKAITAEDAFRTGPNVDIGLEAGVVTVDPNTVEGIAAAEIRKANGAKTTTADGVEEVKPKSK